MIKGEVVTVEFLHPVKEVFFIEEDIWGYTPEMVEYTIPNLECIVPNKVNAIDALVAMQNGKYALKGDYLYKKTGVEITAACKDFDIPWEFAKIGISLNEFLKHEYEILDELPEWAKGPKKSNPFKVGDIVTVRVDGNKEEQREVIKILDSSYIGYASFKGKYRKNRVAQCSLATAEERATFYEKKSNYLKEELRLTKEELQIFGGN